MNKKQFMCNTRRYKNLKGNWKSLGTREKIYFYDEPLERKETHIKC